LAPYNTEIIDVPLQGWKLKVEHYSASDMGAPWDEHDGHGPVRVDHSARSRSYHSSGTGKKPGEVEIHYEDGVSYFYDVVGALKKAREELWGLNPEAMAKLKEKVSDPTMGQILAEAVKQDMAYLEGWLSGRWWWVDLKVTVHDCPAEYLPYKDTEDGEFCCGFESSSDDYLRESALELGDYVIKRMQTAKEAAELAEAERLRVVLATHARVNPEAVESLGVELHLPTSARVVDGWVEAWVRIS
jgi:hypothetical protein